ncbi:hypothetical protein [Endozoicomonas lisbonensis]|uniref:Uncharacterized protein n=1 Tax=Endozoicomonas lisbonensis TaxID=3120522 RepID=A0ABV2SMA0_9GAMM
MNGPINHFRFITLFCFMLFGVLTDSASGSTLNYVLKFNSNSDLGDLSFTVLTDEEARAHERAVETEAEARTRHPGQSDSDRTYEIFTTLTANQPQTTLIFIPANLQQEAARGIRYATYARNLETAERSPAVGFGEPEGPSLSSLTDIHRSRQSEQAGSLTEQHWTNVIMTHFPNINLTGGHARALGYQRVLFSPLFNSVTYEVSSEGSGYYNVTFVARAFASRDTHSEISIPARIYMNDAGIPVHVTFEFNSVPFSVEADDRAGTETQEIAITFSDEEDDTPGEQPAEEIRYELIQRGGNTTTSANLLRLQEHPRPHPPHQHFPFNPSASGSF